MSICVGRALRFAAASLANHEIKGLGNELIEPGEDLGFSAGHIACRERLGAC